MNRETAIKKLYKAQHKLKTLDKYVIFSITVTVVYTVVEFVLSVLTGVHHDTLTTCVYGFFGGEIVTCCLIKIFKLKGERENG